MRLRRAVPADREAVLELLRSSDLPTVGVEETMAGFFVADDGGDMGGTGRVVGTVGLEVHGRHGLLRSLAVEPGYRGLGLGRKLVGEALEAARSADLEGIYLLTTTADEYFLRRGFRVVDRASAPDAVQASVEFAEACPASAVAMALEL